MAITIDPRLLRYSKKTGSYYYSGRDERGRFVRIDNPAELQRYIKRTLDSVSFDVIYNISGQLNRMAKLWTAMHLSSLTVPYDTGNLLASSGVVVSDSETVKTYQGNHMPTINKYGKATGAPIQLERLSTRQRSYRDSSGKKRYAPAGARIRQHWGAPQPGSGFGRTYWREAVEDAPFYGPLASKKRNMCAAILVAAIPYASVVNSKPHPQAGWFDSLAKSFAAAVTQATYLGGYPLTQEVVRELTNERGGLSSSVNW